LDPNSIPAPLSTFDPTNAAVLQCPYPFYEALHREAPVYKVPDAGYYIVSRYADAQVVLRDHQTYSNHWLTRFDGAENIFVPEPVLNHSDPPVHSRTKPIGVRAFGPGPVNALGDYIQNMVDMLIDRFIDRGEVELLSEFASPLPLTVIADQLGIPNDNLAMLKSWSDQMPVFANVAATPEQRTYAAKVIKEANVFLMKKFMEKRENPGNDVLSTLAAATTEPSPDDPDAKPRLLTEGEALSMLQLFLVGGNETTTNALLNGMLLLMRNPQTVADIKAGKGKWTTAIDEFLRLEAPVRGMWRLTTRDTMLSGVAIAADTLVFVSFAAANRDPDQFAHPECLDLARANTNSHLSFGYGIHLCIGFRLARKELEIAFETLFRRLDNIRLTPGKNDFDNLYHHTVMLRAMKSLHLSFDRA
jgi:cytochrome P450